MLNILRISIFLLFALLTINTAFSVESAEIKVLISGKQQNTLSLKEMKEKLKQYKISFFDPYYSKEKNYKAFKLKEFLNYAYGSEWNSGNYTEISFIAFDGYDAASVISNLNQEGGYLVFQDLDFRDWESISFTKAYPGPFYVVWTNPNQTPKNGYPWPWQLETINLNTFEDQFPEVVPKVSDKNSSVFKGYELFKARCVRCHSINQQGGKVGPDLNAPKNILEYRAISFVKKYIKSPSAFRFTHMPDNKDFTEDNLDNLIDYFIYNMKENKWSFEEKN